jgi:hypothetical protein
MARYASGKKSKAISDRSGFEVKYTDLMTTWDGLRVEREEYEPKHPQLTPAKNVIDATALLNPRPDNDPENVKFYVGFNYDPFLDIRKRPPVGIVGTGQIGRVEARLIMAATPSGVAGTSAIGTVGLAINQSITQTGIQALGFIAGRTAGTTTFEITVVNPGSGNVYAIDASNQATLTLYEGNTYYFDQSDSSNSGHPLRFSTTSNGTHGGGSEYTTGVTTSGTPGSAGAYTQIVVASGAPTLYYYCTQHSGMGGTANTPSAITYTPTAKTSNAGTAGTTAVGGQAIIGSPPANAGVAGTGAIGTISVSIGGWGNGGWNQGTWGQ